MAAIRSLKSKRTYKAFIDNFIHFVISAEELKPAFVGIINDTYREKRLKEGTRQDRGEAGPRVHVKGVHQHMVLGVRWEEF